MLDSVQSALQFKFYDLHHPFLVSFTSDPIDFLPQPCQMENDINFWWQISFFNPTWMWTSHIGKRTIKHNVSIGNWVRFLFFLSGRIFGAFPCLLVKNWVFYAYSYVVKFFRGFPSFNHLLFGLGFESYYCNFKDINIVAIRSTLKLP